MFSYKKTNKAIAKDGNKKIYLNESLIEEGSSLSGEKIELIPREDNERTCIYITGSSGVGKTTWIKNFTQAYHKLYPKAPVYLFSEKTEDPSIDKLKFIRRIVINEKITEIVEIPLNNYLEHTLFILDDYIDIQKPFLTAIMTLARKILKLGRQYKLSLMMVSHIINPTTNREFTREVLLESHYVIFFNNDNIRGTTYYWKHYAGLDDKTIQEIKRKKGRVVIHHTRFPQYVITEQEIFNI
jgi:energy-coupling factor transporter ATP-binding protein EcfA2